MTRSTEWMNAMALRILSPRRVYRLGTWPKNGPNRLPMNTVRCSGIHTTSASVVSPPGVDIQLEAPPAEFESVRVDEVVGEFGLGRKCRGGGFDVHEGAPQLHDPPDVERVKAAPVLADVGVVGLGDRLDTRVR